MISPNKFIINNNPSIEHVIYIRQFRTERACGCDAKIENTFKLQFWNFNRFVLAICSWKRRWVSRCMSTVVCSGLHLTLQQKTLRNERWHLDPRSQAPTIPRYRVLPSIGRLSDVVGTLPRFRTFPRVGQPETPSLRKPEMWFSQ